MRQPDFPKRLFDRVFVRPPSSDYRNCHSENPLSKEIDLGLARQQHQEYVSILRESGIQVTILPPLRGHPDSVFLQDPAILGKEGSIICRFGIESRRGEEKALVRDLSRPDLNTGPLRYVEASGSLEGGDVLVTETGFFVGTTGRTDRQGADSLERCFPNAKLTRVPARSFHLLSGCSHLGAKNLIIAPSIVDRNYFVGFRTIELPDEEAYAANTLYLGDGRVLIPSGFPKTRSKLRQAGYVAVELDNSEYWKGDGGISCLSCPLYNVF